MDEARKYAYRSLIYWGLCSIRNVYWHKTALQLGFNPFKIRRQNRQRRLQGALADWLHNAAQFSSWDFERFDEEHFWNDYQRLFEEFGDSVSGYQSWFDNRLKEKNQEIAE